MPHADPRHVRALLLSLFLGVLCVGPALAPGHALLPQDPRAFPPLNSKLSEQDLQRFELEAVPHRRDKLFQFLPYDTAVGEAWRDGRVPLWEPRVLCGIPLVAQATSRAFYPTALAFSLWSPTSVYAWSLLLHLMLGGYFAYRLILRLGGSEAGALLGNASFVLSGYAIGHLHHPMILFAALWALPALECTHAILRPPDDKQSGVRPALLLAAAVALSWFAGFAQASVLLGYLVVGLAFALTIEDWFARRTVHVPRVMLTLGALGLGTALAAIQILPTLELAAHSSRSPPTIEQLRAVALAPVNLLELVLPGQLAAPNDFCPIGPQSPRPTILSLLLMPQQRFPALAAGVYNHTETALGFGIWPLFFAVLGAISVFQRGTRGRAGRAFLFAAASLGLLGAMATPGLVRVLHALPGFAVGDLKRLLMLPAICLPVLAGVGFAPARPRRTTLVVLLGTAALGCGVWMLLAKTATLEGHAVHALFARVGQPTPEHSPFALGEAAMNQAMLGRGFVLLGLALVIGAIGARLPQLGSYGFILATTLELIRVAVSASPAPASGALAPPLPLFPTSVATASPPRRMLRLEPCDDVKRARSDVRLLPPNLPLVFGLADACGYAPLPPRRTERFFEALEPGSTTGGAGIGTLRKPSTLESKLLPLLGLDFLLTSTDETKGWILVDETGGTAVLRPKQAMPRARLYFDVEAVSEAQAVRALTRAALDPLRTAVVETDESPRTGPVDEAATARIVSAAGGEIRVATSAKSASFLVVAEGWAPGWHYEVDDGSTGLAVPAQIMFLGLPLPAGKHVTTLRYAPSGWALGRLVSLIAALLFAGVIVVTRFRAHRGRGR